MNLTRCLKLVIILIVFQAYGKEQELLPDDWSDEWDEETYVWSNRISYAYAGLIDRNSVNRKDNLLNEIRWRTEYEHQFEQLSFNLDLDLIADETAEEVVHEFFALNVFVPFDTGTDLKLGRQVITWGTGDLLFLNDLFPKNWQSFFNGRDDIYLKPAVDALRVSQYSEHVNFEIVLLPEFEPDRIQTGERYSFYFPDQGILQPESPINPRSVNEPEVSARIFGNIAAAEWAIYLYSGYFKSPSKFDQTGASHSEMDSLGASFRTPISSGIFNTEFSYYYSREDEKGVNPLINNSQARLLLGYEFEAADELTLGMQVYWERTLDYNSLLANRLPDQVLPEKDHTVATVRLTQLALQQRLVSSLMMFYSPSEKDYYLRLSSSFTYDDHWKLVAGLNYLDGNDESTFFAQLSDNSNLFVRLSYDFN